jgi:hypothetical protein
MPKLELVLMYSSIHHRFEVLCEELGVFVLQGDGG